MQAVLVPLPALRSLPTDVLRIAALFAEPFPRGHVLGCCATRLDTPYGVAVDGEELFVLSGRSRAPQTVEVFQWAPGRAPEWQRSLALDAARGSAHRIVLHGGEAVVTFANGVDVLDRRDGRVLHALSDRASSGVCVDRATGELYVAHMQPFCVSVYALADRRLLRSFGASAGAWGCTRGTAVAAGELFVTKPIDGCVAVLDSQSGRELRTLPVSKRARPYDVALCGDGEVCARACDPRPGPMRCPRARSWQCSTWTATSWSSGAPTAACGGAGRCRWTSARPRPGPWRSARMAAPRSPPRACLASSCLSE